MQHHLPAHLETGVWGEGLALEYLLARNFSLIERNYREKWGEIDLIMQKGQKIHFVEVKAVSHETREKLEKSVSREIFRPEERVHYKKLQRLGRAIQTWRAKKGNVDAFQLDVCVVRLVPREKYAVVDVIEDVKFE